MTTDATPPPDDPAWAHIRARYEQNQETVKAIAASIGMAAVVLSRKAKQWGWRLRASAKPARQPGAAPATKPTSTTATIKRLKNLLQSRLAQLETQLSDIGAEVSALSSERDIRATNTLVRTLEKVLDLERKDRSRRRKARHDMRRLDDAERAALAEKIAHLQDAWHGEAPVADAPDAGGEGSQ